MLMNYYARSMLSKVLFWIVGAIMVLVPLVFWHGVFFPYTFIKTIVFYALVEIAFVVWLYLALADISYRPRITPISFAVALYLLALGIASLAGVDVSKSIWSDYERMFGVITWLHIGAFFLVLTAVLQNEYKRLFLLRMVVGTAAVVAFIAVWQGFTTNDLSISTIGNAAYLSSYLVPSLFLMLLLLFRERVFSWQVWLYGAGIVFAVVGVLFTQARAGLVGIAAGLGVTALLFLFLGDSEQQTCSVSNRFLKRIVSVLLAFGIFCALLVIFFPSAAAPFVPDRFEQLLDFSVEQRTAGGRILVWQVAWAGWKEQLLFGWGPENFNVLFNTHYIPNLYTVEPWFDRAHNFVFDIGATAGIAGFLAYGALFAAAGIMAVASWRAQRIQFWDMAFLIGLLTAHLAQNLFTFDTVNSALLLIFVFSFIASTQDVSIAPLQKQGNMNAFFYWLPAAAGMVFVLFMVVLQPLRANAAAHTGWELLRAGGGDEAAISEFEKSLSYHTAYSADARRFAAEYLFEFIKQGGRRPDASLLRLMQYAVEKMNENIAEEPKNVKWIMYRGELNSLRAQMFDASFAEVAEADFLYAKELSPGRPQIYLELAQMRKLQGDTDGAWEYLDYLINAIPDYSFGHLNAAVLAIEQDNAGREAEEIEWIRVQGGIGNEALRDAYFKKERYHDAVRIQERIVAFADSDSDAYNAKDRALLYAKLAALYQYAGEIQNARAAAAAVMRLDPMRTSEVEAFLKTLE
jgi:O-antigen ligase/tetratricopeptide (TPR) repeat protein